MPYAAMKPLNNGEGLGVLGCQPSSLSTSHMLMNSKDLASSLHEALHTPTLPHSHIPICFLAGKASLGELGLTSPQGSKRRSAKLG